MIANNKGEIPLVVLILPFLLGISVGLCYSSATLLMWVLAPLLLLAFVFIMLNLNYAWFNVYKVKWLGGVLISLILFLCGWVSAINNNQLNNHDHFSKKAARYLVAKIVSEPTVKNGLVRFSAAVEKQVIDSNQVQASGTLLVAIKDTLASKLYYGDEILIPAKYSAIDPPFNPAEFNYKKYLTNQNIYQQAFLFPKQYKVLGHNNGNPVIAFSLRLRQRLVDKLKLNMHDTSAIAVASTLILGYKADLSNDILQAYSKTGTIHILSVSGGHVAIIYLLLNIVFSFLERYRYGKIIKAVLIISLIWYYSLLTGFSAAVCRAALMISFIIIGKTYSRYINTLNILAASAFILLLYNPYFIVDVGFQLSYLAVAGLIIFQPIVYKWLSFKNKWTDKLWAACSVSIAAQVITFPLSAFYFHQFPVYFLVSNLLITLPVLIIIYIGLALLLIPQIGYISAGLGFLLEKSILMMNKALAVIEHAPFATVGKIWFSTIEYLLAYAITICVFYFLFDKKKWLLNISLALTLVLAVSISLKRYHALQQDSIAFLNLRKHTGIVFNHGTKAVVLSDLGVVDKNYGYSVQPYLDSCKIADTAIYNSAKDIDLKFLKKRGHIIQFNNRKILVLDKSFQNIKLPVKLKVDYLYLTGNAHTTITDLNANYIYSKLIIDATNRDKLITNLKKQAEDSGVNYYILKRNNSLVIPSN